MVLLSPLVLNANIGNQQLANCARAREEEMPSLRQAERYRQVRGHRCRIKRPCIGIQPARQIHRNDPGRERRNRFGRRFDGGHAARAAGELWRVRLARGDLLPSQQQDISEPALNRAGYSGSQQRVHEDVALGHDAAEHSQIRVLFA